MRPENPTRFIDRPMVMVAPAPTSAVSRRVARLNSAAAGSAPEIHYTDIGSAIESFDQAGEIYLLNGVAAGSGFWNRIGSRVAPAYVDVSINIDDRGVVGLTAARNARFAIVWDSAPNGVVPAVSDIFDGFVNAGVSNGPAARYACGVNPVNKNRFTVLKEKYFALPYRTATQNPTPWAEPSFFRMFVKCKGLVTQHASGSTGNIADVRTGALYLVNVCSNDVDPGCYTWGYVARYAFRDI